jgi:REP element-mobilizing transposase RayT
MNNSRQRELYLPTWGGKRRGAGRPRRAARPCVPHRARQRFGHRRAAHVTLRLAKRVVNLRTQFTRKLLERVLLRANGRFGTRIVQLAILNDHIHLLVETASHKDLASAMKGLSVRLAIHLNRLMMESGRRVMGDRYHVHLLTTPTEVRHAAHYIRNNYRKHEKQRGRVFTGVDRYSSDGDFARVVVPVSLFLIRKALGPSWLGVTRLHPLGRRE